MVVGSGIIDIFIPGSRSLKEKRGVLSRIIKRTQNEFNISIAEVGDNDNWQRSRIGISVVGNDRRYIEGKIDHVIHFIDDLMIAEVIGTKMEIVSISADAGDDVYEEGKYD